MTRLQFIALLTPSVGSFVLVVLAWMHSNSRLSDLKESMDRRFTSMGESMKSQFADVDRRFHDMAENMNRRFDEVNRRLELIEKDQKDFFTVTGKLDGRIDELSRR